VCRGNCNCVACLRSDILIKVTSPPFRIRFACDFLGSAFKILPFHFWQEMKQKAKTKEDEHVEFSVYLLQTLLPHLRLLNEEQMIENETEAKIQGIFFY